MKKIFAKMFLLFGISLYAQNYSFESDSRITKKAAESSVMDAELFVRTALIASGADDSEIDILYNTLADYSSKLKKEINSLELTTDSQKAEHMLLFLYDNILSRYSLLQTRVDTAVKNGVYNCVSATILYMYFIKSLEIPIIGVETPLHAFCVVQTEGGNIDVETTNPYGFDPGVKKDISTSENQKKYAIVPSKNYSGRHNKDDRRIISLIYNNRISSLQNQKQNAQTISLASSAYFLQNKSAESSEILSKCVYNTAIDLCSAKKEEESLELIEKAESLWGGSTPSSLYASFRETTVMNMVGSLSNKKDFEGAQSILQKYQNYLSQANKESLQNMITYNSLNKKIATSSFDDAYDELFANKDNLSTKNYNNLFVYLYSTNADKLAKAGDYQKAWELVDEGLLVLKNNSTLLQQKNSYKQNYAIDIHNQAVKYLNEKNYSAAKKIIQEGLAVVENSSLLKNDLKQLE